jgi:hypothetical protein
LPEDPNRPTELDEDFRAAASLPSTTVIDGVTWLDAGATIKNRARQTIQRFAG